MGWAIITHPFHPRRGERFRILKSRTCAGRPTLILEGGESGTFSVLRAWTDRAPPTGATEGKGGPILAVAALLELAALLAAGPGTKKKD